MINLQADLLPGLTPVEVPDSIKSKAAQGMAELKSLSLDDFLDRIAQGAVNFAINLAIAIFIFYLGRFIIRKIYKLLSSIFLRRMVDESLSTFVLSLVNIVLYFILIVTVIGIMGIETTSFLALFASAGVAIGMALSGTLQNFAGGVLILLLKPYRIGNYIEVQGYAGTVSEIQIFFTILKTPDNKSISIPNGAISTGSVNNWSSAKFRRVTWTVAISYGDDVDKARAAILDMFADDTRIEKGETPEGDQIELVTGQPRRPQDSGETIDVMTDDEEEDTTDNSAAAEAEAELSEAPRRSLWNRIMHRHQEAKAILKKREQKRQAEILKRIRKPDYSPKVLVAELADSSVNLQVRAWTKSGQYWDVYYYYNELFYKSLPQHGISFPFPQLDVHLPH